MKTLKKLLALSFSITSSASMVGCSSEKTETNEDLKKNKDGDSIWTKIPNLGNKEITSADIWSQIKLPDPDGWNGKTRMKMVLDVMKIFNVSVLANASKINDDKIKDLADWGELKTLLSQGWDELTASVKDEIKREKESFKNEKQKKWETEWKEFIKKEYGGSEDNLFAQKLVDSKEKNATSILTTILLSNQREIEEYKVKDISGWIQSLINTSDKDKWKADHKEQVDNINKSINNTLSSFKNVDEIITNLKANANTKLVAELINKGLKVNTVPILDENKKEKFLSTNIDGLASHFQSFIMKKWFEVKKPLAISQINFAFKSDSDKLANGVNEDDFDKATQGKINEFLKTTGSLKWDDLMQTYGGTYASDLVTLDNTSFNPIFKLASYALATGKIDPVATSSPNHELKTLLPEINRNKVTTSKKQYIYIKITINGLNFATYVDDSGLHFLKIEGEEFLNDTTTALTSNVVKKTQLETISKWNNDFLPESMSEKTKLLNDKTTTYNNWLGNNYLKWLQNKSYINTKDENSKLKFKIENAFKEFAELSTSTSSDSNKWWFWIFDFFKEYINKCEGKTVADADWYKQYIKFNDKNNEWFNSILNTLESSINTNSLNEFINIINKENKTIQDYSKNYPKVDLDDIGFKEVIEGITTTNQLWKINK